MRMRFWCELQNCICGAKIIITKESKSKLENDSNAGKTIVMLQKRISRPPISSGLFWGLDNIVEPLFVSQRLLSFSSWCWSQTVAKNLVQWCWRGHLIVYIGFWWKARFRMAKQQQQPGPAPIQQAPEKLTINTEM